jgi:pimeloyl-ACP methyl ester carboxylesterase
MTLFLRDGIQFRYEDDGEGLPFVFQHGLGGDASQPLGLYRPAAGVRLIAFDVRGHGETRPLGAIDKLTIANLADDLVALVDHLGLNKIVLGGISLGAAIAVNVALRYPERVRGLVLVRPAWIDKPLEHNVALYTSIARAIREQGPVEGLKAFRKSSAFATLESESPDCARSVVLQFDQPRAQECVARLERLIVDTPCSDRSAYAKLNVPALVLGNRLDPIHPWTLAQELSELIPGAILREVTPKSFSLDDHAADVRCAIDRFFDRRFLPPEGASDA